MNFNIISKVFQRNISNGKKYIPEIDGLRFVAIITVLFFHFLNFIL
jgi:peptidoglycan/LPS O-acetylase OafA/YrhL